MPKSRAALVPVKKNVINKKTGDTSEITYYVNPDKKKTKQHSKSKSKEVNSDKQIPKENELDLSKIKDFEDFGKQGIDPTAARQFFCNL